MSVPKLRFKEFNGNWASLKIKDLVKSLDAGVSVNSEDVEPQDDEYSVLKTSCISSGYFDGNERKRVLQDIEIQRLKEPVLDDSILMSRMNTPILVGMNAYVFKAPKNTFLPDRLWQLKINDSKTVTRWLAFYLGSDQGLNQIRDLASGTSNSMKNITKPDVLNLDLFVPSKPEQTKIASFLSAVDEKISQLTQKHELLSQYKQGMMQKLFSQQLRFKADDGSEFGEWDKKNLVDISNIITGTTPETANKSFYNGSYLFVSPVDIQENRYISQTKTTLTESGFRKCRAIPKNSILFVCIGSTIGKVAQNKKICATNQQINAVIPNDEYCADYVYFQLLLQAQSIKLKAGTQAVPIINKTEFGKTTLLMPCLEEQTKIANFLSSIDQKIEVVTQQIEHAKQWKKGLLQQMFV